jgi:FMN phosphatase YigB (HAD superfamily)
MNRLYKAIFFDLDGTLRIATPSPVAAFISLVRSLGVPVDEVTERRVQLWSHRFWGQDEWIQQEVERLGKDMFWLNYSRRLLETIHVTEALWERAQLVRDWFYYHYEPQVSLASGCYDVLCRLKAAGYALGLISNRPSPLQEVVTELRLDGLFDLLLAAGDIGCWKPNPAIFAHALAQFHGLRPEECLYVGDNYYADGHGAQKAGLVPVLFDPEHLYEKPAYHRITHWRELLPLLGHRPSPAIP